MVEDNLTIGRLCSPQLTNFIASRVHPVVGVRIAMTGTGGCRSYCGAPHGAIKAVLLTAEAVTNMD